MKVQPTQTTVSARTKEGFDNFMFKAKNVYYSDNNRMVRAYDKISA